MQRENVTVLMIKYQFTKSLIAVQNDIESNGHIRFKEPHHMTSDD